jgi:signal transduction histidine kinase
MMPGMDGWEVLHHIRTRYSSTDLAVIMVTALGESQEMVRGLEMGANDYLPKPVQFEVLLARVRTQLKLKELLDQRARDIERLRELDAIKDKFLQIAAHDLKNPLNNIVMSVELLSTPGVLTVEVRPQYDQTVGMIRSAAQVMQAIISDFLDLQTIQNGRLTLKWQDTSLNDVAANVVHQFTPYAKNKQVSLVVELDGAMPICLADPVRLVQVASNLVGNAIKFSPPGAAVKVRTHAGDGRLRFEVEDNGPGIPAAEMGLLFQEFARLSNRPTGGEKSSGVGLAIARHLVELHGGQIGARSEVGVGSLFWFEMPYRPPTG